MSTAEVIDFYKHQNRKMNNGKKGHFDIYRSLLDAEWSTDAFKLSCFIRLIGQAAYKPKTVNFNHREWHLARGQLVVRIEDLASKLRDRNGKAISRDAVERILKFFKQKGMLNISGSRYGTLITITNYDKYQNDIYADNTADNETSKNKASETHAADNIADNNNIAAVAGIIADNTADNKPSENKDLEPYAADNVLSATAQYEQEVKNNNITNKNTMSFSNDESRQKSNTEKINYQEIADVYNEILGDRLPNIKKITDKRKKLIKSFMFRHLNKHTLEAAISYFVAFRDRAKPFYFGDNKTGWIANFDFVIRESTVIAVREGTISKAEFTE